LLHPQKGDICGIKSLFGGKKGRIVKYQMKSSINEKQEAENIRLAIASKYAKKKYKCKGVNYFAYVLIGVDLKPRVCYEKYRKRFGIETSYRLMNTIRARTSSCSPELRLLYVAVSLILQNAWVYTNWSYMRERKQGQRKAKNGITLQSFVDLIMEGIKVLMGAVREVIGINTPRVDLLNLNTSNTYLGVI
jgi:putative transposase